MISIRTRRFLPDNHASNSGANEKISDESFELFCARDDLPQFDFIGLHGIWSWISDKNRLIIRDFLDKMDAWQ